MTEPSPGRRATRPASGSDSTGSEPKSGSQSGGSAGASSGSRAARGGAHSAGGSGGRRTGGSSASGGGRRPPRKGRFRRFVKWTLIAGIVFVIVCCATFFLAYESTKIPNANAAFKAETTFVYYANGQSKIGTFASQNRISVPLAKISKPMQQAAVAAEDRSFWTNKGIDPKGIIRAAFSNAQGNATQGASTITQQYVKLLYLNQSRTLKRKVREAFLSLKIQKEKSKRQILEGYLNTVYFGRGAYGVQAAAQAWFGTDAKHLNLRQSAMLASILNSPNHLNPDHGNKARRSLLERYHYVLGGMAKAGGVTESDAATAGKHLPSLIKRRIDVYAGQKGFMMSMIKSQLEKLGFDESTIEGGGLRVTTTLTRPAMTAAEDGVGQVRPDVGKDLHVGVASVDTHTGALLGFYAGQDFLTSQLNWATAQDSPGSAFKPFALATALKAGWNLHSAFDGDSPLTIHDLEVNNESDASGQPSDYGNVTLLTALQESINTAFVDMTNDTPKGPDRIKKTAVAMGMPKKNLTPNTTIALGSDPVSPVQLANAYSTIADGGTYRPWYLIKKVTRASDGKVLYAHKNKGKRAISSDIAADVTYAMEHVVQSGTGVKALALGRPAAGKTGTATDGKDHVVTSWFAGFTPQVATAVMYARGDGRQPLDDGFLSTYYGADYPTETWTAVMKAIMDGYDEQDFPPPAFVEGDPPQPGHVYVPPPPPAPPPAPSGGGGGHHKGGGGHKGHKPGGGHGGGHKHH